MPFDETTPLQVEQINMKDWKLLADLKYQGKTDSFVVPKDFTTDFASVPRMFTWLVPRSGAYAKAAALHDFLCEQKDFPRNDADGIFRRAMGELGVPTVRRYVMWATVRVASLLRGAKVRDVIGVILLALLILPIAIPGAVYVLSALVLLLIVEIVVWAVLKALGKNPIGPVRFWWA